MYLMAIIERLIQVLISSLLSYSRSLLQISDVSLLLRISSCSLRHFHRFLVIIIDISNFILRGRNIHSSFLFWLWVLILLVFVYDAKRTIFKKDGTLRRLYLIHTIVIHS